MNIDFKFSLNYLDEVTLPRLEFSEGKDLLDTNDFTYLNEFVPEEK